MNPDQLKQMIQWSSQNPTAPQATEFKNRLQSGAYNDSASKLGLKPGQLGVKKQEEQKKPGISETIGTAVGDTFKRAAGAVSAFQTDRPLSEKVGKSLDVVTGAAGAVFSPVAGVLNEVSNRGGAPGKLAAKVVEKPFELLGKAGSYVGEKAVNALPLNEQDKGNLREPVKEAGALIAQLAGGKAGEVVAPKVVSGAKDLVKGVKEKVAVPVREGITAVSEVGTGKVSEALNNVQNKIARGNVQENFGTSVERLANSVEPTIKNPDGTPAPSVRRDPLKMYDEFYKQEQLFKNDIKQDTAIGKVGEVMGDGYNQIAKMRSEAGKVMAKEMERVGEIRTDVSEALTKLSEEIKRNGLEQIIDEKGVHLSPNKKSKVTNEDAKLLEEYTADLSRLGDKPSAAELDAFLSRTPANLDVYKAKNNITKTTNGERIVKWHLANLRDALKPEKNPEFEGYSRAKADYAALTAYLDEGAGFLGKKTASGDYAKDASVAKSAVQSILNGGKKDWMLQMEELTGIPVLDMTVLALQAMKDSGNFRGQSLLDLLTPKESMSIPTSAKGMVMAGLEKGLEYGKEKVSGTPYEQTRRVIEERLRQGEATVPSQFEMPENKGSTDARAGFMDLNAPIEFPKISAKDILKKFAPPKAALDEMANFTEYAVQKKKDPAYEANVRDMASKFGINPEQTNAQLVKMFTEILDEAKYGETLK